MPLVPEAYYSRFSLQIVSAIVGRFGATLFLFGTFYLVSKHQNEHSSARFCSFFWPIGVLCISVVAESVSSVVIRRAMQRKDHSNARIKPELILSAIKSGMVILAIVWIALLLFFSLFAWGNFKDVPSLPFLIVALSWGSAICSSAFVGELARAREQRVITALFSGRNGSFFLNGSIFFALLIASLTDLKHEVIFYAVICGATLPSVLFSGFYLSQILREDKTGLLLKDDSAGLLAESAQTAGYLSLNQLIETIDLLILGMFIDSPEVLCIAVARRLVFLVTAPQVLMCTAISPYLAELLGLQRVAELRVFVKTVAIASTFLAIVISVPFFLYAENIMSLFSIDSPYNGDVLRLSVLGGAIAIMTGCSGPLLAMSARRSTLVYISITRAVIYLPALLFFSRFGPLSAVCTIACCMLLGDLLTWYLAWRLCKIDTSPLLSLSEISLQLRRVRSRLQSS